jgi:processive 1,2-diacylglycerol beta-glucosyltransferase
MELQRPAQTVVVCGKSDELRAKITQIVGEDNRAFRVLGYSDRMHELMRMSDLFIGKPGGLTTSEALACGLPMAIVSPIPGQEERNSDHLLEEGAAIKCNELTTIPFKVDRLLRDPARLERMRQNALRLGRPRAAHDVVEMLLADNLPPLVLDETKREAIALAATGESAE